MHVITFALASLVMVCNAGKDITLACYGTKSLCKALLLSRSPEHFQSMTKLGNKQREEPVPSDALSMLLFAMNPGIMKSQLARGLAVEPRPGRLAAMSPKMSVGLYYSTSTGNTETVAEYIADKTGIEGWNDIADVETDEVLAHDAIIIGAPTWHTGADKERSGTSWDEWLYDTLPDMDFSGKKVAIFGVGDSAGYGDNYCDATGELYDCFTAKGAKIYGMTPAEDGIEYTESKSVRDGKFVAKAFDEDNFSDMSEDRVSEWLEQLKSEGFM